MVIVCLGVVLGGAFINQAEGGSTGEAEASAENWAPWIYVNSPEDGASYPAGATIPFEATAWDDDGTVEWVGFYLDSVFVAYASQTSSPYGISLSGVAPGVHTLTAVAWDNAGASTMSASLTITVGSSSSGNQPPSVSVTSPVEGASYPAGATIPFEATAWDADGTVEWVAFYVDSALYAVQSSEPYGISLPNVAPGVYTLMVVAWDNAGETTTSSRILTVGPSQSINQPPSVTVTSPASGASYPAGATIPFEATAWDADGTIQWVAFYVDSVFVAYAAQRSNPYSISLPNAPAGVHTVTVVAWDNAGASTLSAGHTFTVGSSGSGNQPPSVSISSPANGASYPAGATIPFQATAWDADGTITWVAFYVNSAVYAVQSSSPYGLSLSNLPAGAYTLTVEAWDNTGASSTSAAHRLTVGSSSPAPPASNQPPIVSLTAPASGATFNAPATITVSATASDPDGTIAQVEFYANGSLIRTDPSSPYSFSWTNVVAGNYSLTAVARDNAGATTVSSTRDISVRSANLPGTAVFVPSSNHTTAVDRYVLEVFPAGADPTVANPVATRDLGKPAISNGECRADISSTIQALTPGNYIATITAMGSGGSAQSAPSPQFTR